MGTINTTLLDTSATGEQRVVPADARCCERVFSSDRASSFRGHMCTKKASVEINGKFYCATHDPEKVKRRKEKQQQKYDQQSALRMKQWRLEGAAPDLLKFAQHVANQFADAKHPGSVEVRLRDEALSLIAKATGRGSPEANYPSNVDGVVP